MGNDNPPLKNSGVFRDLLSSILSFTDKSGKYRVSGNGIVNAEYAPEAKNKFKNPVISIDEVPQQQPRLRSDKFNYTDKASFPEQYQPYVYDSARQYNIDPYILASLIASETGGLPQPYSPAVSSAGAVGMSQIIPDWHYQKAGYSDPMEYSNRLATDNPYAISESARILSEYLQNADNNIYDALAAYNAGFGNIDAGYPYAQQVLDRVGYSY